MLAEWSNKKMFQMILGGVRLLSKDRPPEQCVYLLPGSEEGKIPLVSGCQRMQNLADARIPTLRGGERRRPELKSGPGGRYGAGEAASYDNPRVEAIQRALATQALRLVTEGNPNRCLLLLDVGCGTCLGAPVWGKARGFVLGTDVSPEMLSAAKGAPGDFDVLAFDSCLPLTLRPSVFDAAISVSFLQWLLVKRDCGKYLDVFYRSLFECLVPGGRFVLQFYVRDRADIEVAYKHALAYFSGALFFLRPCAVRGTKIFLYLYKR